MADNNETPRQGPPESAKWIALAILLAIVAFMYATVSYRIVHFGP